MVSRVDGSYRVGTGGISATRTGATTATNKTSQSQVKTYFEGSIAASYQEQFTFPDDEQTLEIGKGTTEQSDGRLFQHLLEELFLRVVMAGIIITPTPPRAVGNAVVEASLIQDPQGYKPPELRIPLRNVNKPLTRIGYTRKELREQINQYICQIMAATNDKESLRILVVTAHEYGHYLSYKLGNHTPKLSKALQMFRSRQFTRSDINSHLKYIFQEEVMAWRLGKEQLKDLDFEHWAFFNSVKENSLATYADLLKLRELYMSNTISLSFLGPDFHQAMKPRQDTASFTKNSIPSVNS